MAIVVDQASIGTATDSTTAAAVSFTTTQTVASGGFIVVVAGFFSNTLPVTVSGGGLSWTTDKEGRPGSPGGDYVVIASAQAPSGLASGTVITATPSGGTTSARTIGGMSFTGVATSSPVDGTPLGPTGSAVAAWSSGSYAIAAGSVIVAHCFSEGTITGSTATGPSVEAFEAFNAGDGYGSVAEYRIEASAGSYSVAGAWNTNAPNANVAVAYLASGSVPQTLRPDADTTTTGWTTTPLWSKIEETSADGTVITATAS